MITWTEDIGQGRGVQEAPVTGVGVGVGVCVSQPRARKPGVNW